MPALEFAARQRQVVAAFLSGEPQLGTRLLPFHPVGGNPVPARTVVRQQMSEFMKKGARHFRLSKLQKPGIESDERAPGKSGACCAPHPEVPSDLQAVRELMATQRF